MENRSIVDAATCFSTFVIQDQNTRNAPFNLHFEKKKKNKKKTNKQTNKQFSYKMPPRLEP